MISYKEYKQLQENFVGLTGGTLGIKSPGVLGLMGAHTAGEKSVEELLDEAKKKAKKKMLAGAGTGQPTDDGDGEMVKPSAVKDADVDADDDDDDDDVDDDGDDEDSPADDAGENAVDDDGSDLDAPKYAKKKMKKKMSADDKCSKCHKSPCICSDVKKKFKEAMMEEMETEFFSSLRSMMSPPKSRDFKPVSEELLINPQDPNFGLVAQDASEPVQTVSEPAPGEVGFAPDTVLGGPLGGYSESVKKK